MEFSYWASNGQSWDAIVDGCRWAVDAGWRGIWLPDHFMPAADADNGPGPTEAELAPMLEAWTTLAALAVTVPRVRVGLMVGGNTYRHPAVVAKMAATIDQLSKGRAVVGLGAGWQRNEHERYAMELGSVAERSDRLEEACALIKLMLGPDERIDFAGRHYRLSGAPASPKPVQPVLPLLVGGRGEKRTLRTVARYADEWNAWGRPDDMRHSRSVLARHADAEGRDVDGIWVTAAAALHICESESEAEDRRARLSHRGGLVGTVDQLRRIVDDYAEAGVDELVIPDFSFDPSVPSRTVLDRFEAEVAR